MWMTLLTCRQLALPCAGPAHHGGGTPTREDAERDCLSAIVFALEGDSRDYDTDAETLTLDVNVAPAARGQDFTAASPSAAQQLTPPSSASTRRGMRARFRGNVTYMACHRHDDPGRRLSAA
jgi:hypothetical protein